jgi:hypothetical protein
VLVLAISAAFAFSVFAETSATRRKGRSKVAPRFRKTTIEQRAARGEVVEVKREDDSNGKMELRRLRQDQLGFEVDPNGKFVKRRTGIKR